MLLWLANALEKKMYPQADGEMTHMKNDYQLFDYFFPLKLGGEERLI